MCKKIIKNEIKENKRKLREGLVDNGLTEAYTLQKKLFCFKKRWTVIISPKEVENPQPLLSM
jgi:hypothetical protein